MSSVYLPLTDSTQDLAVGYLEAGRNNADEATEYIGDYSVVVSSCPRSATCIEIAGRI